MGRACGHGQMASDTTRAEKLQSYTQAFYNQVRLKAREKEEETSGEDEDAHTANQRS